jgi:hypothetical protein
MKLLFRMNWSLRRAAIEDLRRPHEFAHERVGFLCCRAAEIDHGIMVLAESYAPVADENYVEDHTVGARINGVAIRAALQASLTSGAGLFHVHLHEHEGLPGQSRTDDSESKKLIPDFFNVTASMPHGTIIFSADSACGLCWLEKFSNPRAFDRIEFVGSPFRIIERWA